MTEKQLRAAEARQTLSAVDMLLFVCGGVPNDRRLPIVKQFLEQLESGGEHQ